MEDSEQGEDLDLTYVSKGENQQRVNVYHQQGRLCTTIRIINNVVLTLDELLMPDILKQLVARPYDLILVTGPTGSGKSMTLATVMDYINERRNYHILTIENPVEYVYQRKQALIHQREIGRDEDSFDTTFRSAVCEDPDIILVGEVYDYEIIAAVVILAEAGHLVFSTLYTTRAAETIDRVIDVFPPHRQEQIRMQVSSILGAVITQQLFPKRNGNGRIAALEVMIGTDAISSMIRESEVHWINSIIQTGMHERMQSLNFALTRLVQNSMVTREMAEKYSGDPQELKQYLQQNPVSAVHRIRIRLVNSVQVPYNSERKR